MSTLYLIAALRENIETHGASSSHKPMVWGTEHEKSKVEHAYNYIKQGFEENDEAKDIFKKGEVKKS